MKYRKIWMAALMGIVLLVSIFGVLLSHKVRKSDWLKTRQNEKLIYDDENGRSLSGGNIPKFKTSSRVMSKADFSTEERELFSKNFKNYNSLLFAGTWQTKLRDGKIEVIYNFSGDTKGEFPGAGMFQIHKIEGKYYVNGRQLK